MSIELTQQEKDHLLLDFYRQEGEIGTWPNLILDRVIYAYSRITESRYLEIAEDQINEGGWEEDDESIREKWRTYFNSSQTTLQKVKVLLSERKQALIATMPAAEREALLQFTHPPHDPASDRLWSEGADPLTSPKGEVHVALCALQAKGLIEATYNDTLERLEWELRESKAQEVLIPLLYQGDTP